MPSPTHHSRNASPQFRSIKAVFEQADTPTMTPPRPFSRGSNNSHPKTPTDDPPNPVASLISRETFKDQQQTIDALLEVSTDSRWPAASPRPQLRPKSSWIGPPPSARQPSHGSTTAAMSRKVTITYTHVGLRPPVYITTSLSEPQWELLEMGSSQLPDGDWEFVKTFHAVDGEYQYKFRLGPGDWWVCDEGKPTVDDGFGDRNNVLVVNAGYPAPAKKSAAEPPSEVEHASAENHAPTLPHERDVAKMESKRDSVGDEVVGKASEHPFEEHEKHQSPLFSHEQIGSTHPKLEIPPEDVPMSFSRQDTQALDDGDESNVGPAHPLLAHERDVGDLPDRTPTPGSDEGDDHFPPLMKHETLSPVSSRQDVPHYEDQDSYAIGSPTSSHSSHIPAEADPNDPSLEKFPTHHEGIMSSLRRSSMRLSEDETKEDVLAATSPITKSTSYASSVSPSLPSVQEDEEEEEDEDEDEEHAKTTTAPSSGPKAQSLATGLHILSETKERPAALMTPPRTPDEPRSPQAAASHSSSHHHKPAAEKDMHEEATHDVKHHESHHHHGHHEKTAEEVPVLDGDEEPTQAKESESKEDSKPATAPETKSPRSGFFETALGLGLFVAVGVGAAWLAFMMQDPIKDGGAVLSGRS